MSRSVLIGRFLLPSLLGSAIIVSGPPAATAEDCSVRNSYTTGVALGIAVNAGNGISTSDVSTAIGSSYWGGCSGLGTGMPGLCTSCSATVSVSAVFQAGESTNQSGSCGRFTPTFTVQPDGTQRMSGGTIVIYESERGTGVDCEPYADRIAHEIGHVLGLDDASGAGCNGHIMGGRVQGQNRSVGADDCQQARDAWDTPSEVVPDDPNDDGGGPCGV
jgi:hypothetical protein